MFAILNNNLSGLTMLALILGYILAVVLAIVFHEFSHAFVAYKFGDPTPKFTGRLTLNPARHFDTFGLISFLFVGFGWAKPVMINPLNFRNFKKGQRCVAISGITTNLALCILFSALAFFLSPLLLTTSNAFCEFLYFFLNYSCMINLALAIFNLLPIYPLDGYNFIRTYLSPDNGFVQVMEKYGSFILFIFILTPLFDWLYSFSINGILGGLNMFWGLF
jgi:Zn-dependent protease